MALRVAKLFKQTLGFDDVRFFVNSAQSLARESYNSLWLPDGNKLEVNINGSVDSKQLIEALGLDPIVGRTALRTWLQGRHLHKKPISRSAAKNYVNEMIRSGVLNMMKTDTGQAIPWAPKKVLVKWLAMHSHNKHTRAGRAVTATSFRQIGGTIFSHEVASKLADRIQARAIRRCGELLKQIEPARGANQNISDDADTKVLTRKEAATQAGLNAGLSEHQRKDVSVSRW